MTISNKIASPECSGVAFTLPQWAQVLIVSDDSNTEQLESVARQIGVVWKTARNMTDACEQAQTGRFQVILAKPLLSDGSWKRLLDLSSHYGLIFEIVLVVAGEFSESAAKDAREEGVFDVLPGAGNLEKLSQATKCALWVAYLKGSGPTQNERNSGKLKSSHAESRSAGQTPV